MLLNRVSSSMIIILFLTLHQLCLGNLNSVILSLIKEWGKYSESCTILTLEMPEDLIVDLTDRLPETPFINLNSFEKSSEGKLYLEIKMHLLNLYFLRYFSLKFNDSVESTIGLCYCYKSNCKV